jgi:phytoene/squalene synthetase
MFFGRWQQEAGMAENLDFCGEMVRRDDPDRFFLSLLAPAQHRRAFWVLDALNIELSRIRETVTDPHVGLIRLQWWRDNIERIYEGQTISGNGVLAGLAETIRTYGLPADEFEHLLVAREMDLQDTLSVSLMNYASAIHGPLVRLKAKVLEDIAVPKNNSTDFCIPDERSDDPESMDSCLRRNANSYKSEVENVAVSYAVVGLIRAIPFHAAQGRVVVPGLSLNDIKPGSEKMKEVVRRIFNSLSLNPSPSLKKGRGKYFRAMGKLAWMYKQQIEKAGYDPFYVRPPAFKEIRLLFA